MKKHINIVSDDDGVFSAASIQVHFQKVYQTPDDITEQKNYGPTHNVTAVIPEAALTNIANALNTRLDATATQSIIAAAKAARQQGPQ